jgi:5-formyltetrahydrofolate cyclo-ligase
MIDEMAQQKRILRRELRERRRAFVSRRANAPWFPANHPLADMLRIGDIVTTYASMGSEADPSPLNALVCAAGAVLAWPRVDTDQTMRFYALGPSAQMVPDAANIAAPAADAIHVAPDIILLPLLGFDRRGTRLGQGAGYYDRTMAMLDAARDPALPRARRIGVAWSMQEVDALPCDQWDIPLDAIITELQWIEP